MQEDQRKTSYARTSPTAAAIMRIARYWFPRGKRFPVAEAQTRVTPETNKKTGSFHDDHRS
jgi:hypothetical protein